jgi:hypothetical protein
LEHLIESISDGILAFDREVFATSCGAGLWSVLTGMERQQVMGQSLFDLFPHVRDTRDGASV